MTKKLLTQIRQLNIWFEAVRQFRNTTDWFLGEVKNISKSSLAR